MGGYNGGVWMARALLRHRLSTGSWSKSACEPQASQRCPHASSSDPRMLLAGCFNYSLLSQHLHNGEPGLCGLRCLRAATMWRLTRSQAAVAALNTLQSNFSIVDAIRKSGRGMNQAAIPEMLEWCRKIGYEVCDRQRLHTTTVSNSPSPQTSLL
jgi:hypothetical protein